MPASRTCRAGPAAPGAGALALPLLVARPTPRTRPSALLYATGPRPVKRAGQTRGRSVGGPLDGLSQSACERPLEDGLPPVGAGGGVQMGADPRREVAEQRPGLSGVQLLAQAPVDEL